MNKSLYLASLITAALPALTPAFADSSTPLAALENHQQKAQLQTPKRYIVSFKNNTFKNNTFKNNSISSATKLNHPNVFSKGQFSSAKANLFIQQQGGKVKHNLKSISAIAAELTPAQIKQLKSNPQVQRIEEDPPRYAQAAGAPYGIAMVQADLVSDSETGNQKVCVIDTGYDINHEDLMNAGNITGEVNNTLTATVNLGDWSSDTYGHGTHVAGIISSLNNSVGTQGVAPNGLINLHIVKVIDKANYWEYWGSDVIAAVEACQTAGANVINMSLAGSKSSAAEQAAIDAAYNSGTLLVGAAGNRGNNTYYYPAAYDSVISVGAVDQQGDAWANSQFNDQIELAAPGVGVESTLPNNRYGFMDGTSAAAPFVSGVAALVWSHHPDCSNTEIRDALRRSAQDRGDPGRDDYYGNGIIQAKAADDLLSAEGCNANTANVVTNESDPAVFTNNTTVEPVFELIAGLTTGLEPDVFVTQASAAGVRCVAASGFTLQSSNNRIAVQSGSFTFAFDLGVKSVSFNAYLQGAPATVTVTTASGKTNVVNLSADGFVGLTSDEDIVSVTILGADGLELSDFSRSSGPVGLSSYSDASAFAGEGTTFTVEDIANSTTKDQWFSQINSNALSCVSPNNVGIASADSSDFSVAPSSSDIITSNGNQDFTINFNFQPNLISFNTHLNEYGPATLTITTVDDVATEYTIAHDPDIVGFFGLNSVQKIKSIRWVSVNGWLVKTGISELKTNVLPTVSGSCKAILDNGGNTGDGLYNIDPDGPGPIEAFEAYCDMTTQGGGWTLYATHSSGITPVVNDPVSPTVEGVMTDAHWLAVRDNMSTGMMFKDIEGRVSVISAEKLWAGNCVSLNDTPSLINNPNRDGAIWYNENSGCGGTGQDYSIIFLGSASVYGASVYNLSTVKFDIFPYSAASYTSTNTLRYFIK